MSAILRHIIIINFSVTFILAESIISSYIIIFWFILLNIWIFALFTICVSFTFNVFIVITNISNSVALTCNGRINIVL